MARNLRYYILLIIVLIGGLSIRVSVAAPNSFKLGVVDTHNVLQKYKKAQEANEVLQTAQDRLTTQLRDIQKEVETMEERLTKQKLFLPDPETATLETDINLKKQEFQRGLEVGQESIRAKEKELFEPILKEIEDLLQKVGKSEGYSLILEKRVVALYVDASYDLTERIIKLLNDQYEKDNPKNSKESTPPDKEIGKTEEKNDG